MGRTLQPEKTILERGGRLRERAAGDSVLIVLVDDVFAFVRGLVGAGLFQ